MNWADVLKRLPRKEFISKFSRSSGPGGQNVNKVNTKATIKLERERVAAASWLAPELRDKLMQPGFRYLTPRGDIVVTSELTRSQQSNLEDCYEKLSKAISQAAFVPAEPSAQSRQRWEKLSKREKAVKKETKKRHASKKKERSFRDYD